MQKRDTLPTGLYYNYPFLNRKDREALLSWLKTLHPLWEMRFSKHNPPPEGDKQRQLLRPVYWLGNWQFACLDYYHPPQGIMYRCLEAEPYPKLLKEIVARIEFCAKKYLPKNSFPKDWELNTCLINFYGNKWEEDKWVDRARVGEHKDFEPGPVASLSLGDRAFFQFVHGKQNLDSNFVFSQWLEDSSLQIFGGERWKSKTFHRVQRVEDKRGEKLGPEIINFQTRRINFTFRYVPREHIFKLKEMPSEQKEDISPYLHVLAENSNYFKNLLQDL